jgi:hypothetical protein
MVQSSVEHLVQLVTSAIANSVQVNRHVTDHMCYYHNINRSTKPAHFQQMIE